MSLKEWISGILKKRNSSKIDNVLKSLVKNYTLKIALLQELREGKIREEEFKQRFLEFLDVDVALSKVEDGLLNDESIKKDFYSWRFSIDHQKGAVDQDKLDIKKLMQNLTIESNILSLEIKGVKKIESNILNIEEINKNMQKIKDLGFPTAAYETTAYLLATNIDLVNTLVSKIAPEDVELFFKHLFSELKVYSKEDLEVFVELAGKIKPENVYQVFNVLCILKHTSYTKSNEEVATFLVGSIEDVIPVGQLLAEIAGKTKPEDLRELLGTALPLMVHIGLIKSKEDIIPIGQLLIELARKQALQLLPKGFIIGKGIGYVTSLIVESKERLKVLIYITGRIKQNRLRDSLLYALLSMKKANLIKPTEDIMPIVQVLIEITEKLKPENVKELFEGALPEIIKAGLIKSLTDLKNMKPLLIEIFSQSSNQNIVYNKKFIEEFAKRFENITK